MKTFEEVYRVIEFMNSMDMEFWTHAYANGIHISLNCNDFFYWACADSEDIELADIPLIEKAIEDVKLVLPELRSYEQQSHGLYLWAARKRGHAPQKPVLEKELPEMQALYLAVGDPVNCLCCEKDV